MFKKCSHCGNEWSKFEAFLLDHHLIFSGYQAGFRNPNEGLFLFNHLKTDCKTTLAVKVDSFRELLMPNAVFSAFKPHGEGCPGHCADQKNLEPCHNSMCSGHLVRMLMQELKKSMMTAA